MPILWDIQEAAEGNLNDAHKARLLDFITKEKLDQYKNEL